MTTADPALLRQLDEYWIHSRHPSGALIAAEVTDALAGECAVWDLDTGELVWRPRARCVAWSADGSRAALLTGEYGETFELRSWPERARITQCNVEPWACCNEHVALSPRGDRAAVLWWHQAEGGVNLVAFDCDRAHALESPRYMTRETHLLQGPVFDPDGVRVAVSEGFSLWWLPDRAGDPAEQPSPGGFFRRGRLTVMDVDTGSLSQFDVEAEVPEGWIPPREPEELFELLGKPRFESADDVVLEPTFGDRKRFRVGRSGAL